MIMSRDKGQRSYKKVFFISTEGEKTEPDYFRLLQEMNNNIVIKTYAPCKGKGKSDPKHVLSRLKSALKDSRKGDQAWAVIDRDNWQETEIQKLYDWSQDEDGRGLALTNPCIEYWLLLHFEDGNSVSTKENITTRLKNHIPNYNKSVPSHVTVLEKIHQAILRAKRRDTPACENWPHDIGNSTLYRLVEQLLPPS